MKPDHVGARDELELIEQASRETLRDLHREWLKDSPSGV